MKTAAYSVVIIIVNTFTVDDTYIELNHNLTEYPSVVKVRAKLADGDDIGWYSDAQGSLILLILKIMYKACTIPFCFKAKEFNIRLYICS